MEVNTAGRQSSTGTNTQRIAELERQLNELREELHETVACLKVAYAAGHEHGRQSITGRRTPAPRPQRLRLLGGAS